MIKQNGNFINEITNEAIYDYKTTGPLHEVSL